MIYHLAAHRHRYDDVPRFTIFPIRNTNFVEIENQFSCTSLNVFFQILDYSVKEPLWCLQALLSLNDTFHVDDLIGVTKSKQIHPAPSDCSLELAHIEFVEKPVIC
jgi:hypothetical protein